MNNELINELNINLSKIENSNIPIINEYLQNINSEMKELNTILKDILSNNYNSLQNKNKELLIQKKSMEPFIKYLMIYNMFLQNTN